MKTTFYKVDERALQYLERYNGLRRNQLVPVVVPCLGRVPCKNLAEEVCQWFDKHGYPRITVDEPSTGSDEDLDEEAPSSDEEP